MCRPTLPEDPKTKKNWQKNPGRRNIRHGHRGHCERYDDSYGKPPDAKPVGNPTGQGQETGANQRTYCVEATEDAIAEAEITLQPGNKYANEVGLAKRG